MLLGYGALLRLCLWRHGLFLFLQHALCLCGRAGLRSCPALLHCRQADEQHCEQHHRREQYPHDRPYRPLAGIGSRREKLDSACVQGECRAVLRFRGYGYLLDLIYPVKRESSVSPLPGDKCRRAVKDHPLAVLRADEGKGHFRCVVGAQRLQREHQYIILLVYRKGVSIAFYHTGAVRLALYAEDYSVLPRDKARERLGSLVGDKLITSSVGKVGDIYALILIRYTARVLSYAGAVDKDIGEKLARYHRELVLSHKRAQALGYAVLIGFGEGIQRLIRAACRAVRSVKPDGFPLLGVAPRIVYKCVYPVAGEGLIVCAKK